MGKVNEVRSSGPVNTLETTQVLLCFIPLVCLFTMAIQGLPCIFTKLLGTCIIQFCLKVPTLGGKH